VLKAYIDGSIGPKNPGTIATYGFEVRRNGDTIHNQGGIVVKGDKPVYSNNIAEYGALIEFFKWYWWAYDNNLLIMEACVEINKPEQMWCEGAIVHSDSQLIVNQMNGKWAAGQGTYLPYYRKARSMYSDRLHKFVGIKWIPRDENIVADEISKYHHYV